MTLADAVRQLVLGEGRDCGVLTRNDLMLFFPNDTPRSFAAGLAMLVEVGLLKRVSRSVYVNAASRQGPAAASDALIAALRPGHLNYVSYESALADVGSLSQQPFCRTLATTGRTGVHDTPFGRYVFRHTNRSRAEIVANTVPDGGVLVAHPDLALADLRRAVPALVPSIDMEDHAEISAEWGPCNV